MIIHMNNVCDKQIVVFHRIRFYTVISKLSIDEQTTDRCNSPFFHSIIITCNTSIGTRAKTSGGGKNPIIILTMMIIIIIICIYRARPIEIFDSLFVTYLLSDRPRRQINHKLPSILTLSESMLCLPEKRFISNIHIHTFINIFI